MLEDEVKHAVGVLQLLSAGFDGGIFDAEEAVKNEAGIVKGGNRLSAATKGKGACSGGLTDTAIDGKAE